MVLGGESNRVTELLWRISAGDAVVVKVVVGGDGRLRGVGGGLWVVKGRWWWIVGC